MELKLGESQNICVHPLDVKSALAKLSEPPREAREGATIGVKILYWKIIQNFILFILLVWVKSGLCLYSYPA